MYNYPLTFSFSAFAISPNIEVKDASGKTLMTAAKKLISSKEEITVTTGAQPLFKIISQESRITDIPSNWDVMTADGKAIGVVDDDFISAVDTSKFTDSRFMNSMMQMQVERALRLKNLKMYWIKDTAGKKLGLIAPEKQSLLLQQLPLYQIIRQLPFAFRFITPFYYIRLGEETVMKLQKKRTFFIDTYTLEASGKFREQDEQLLVPSVILAIVYERQQLKDLFGD